MDIAQEVRFRPRRGAATGAAAAAAAGTAREGAAAAPASNMMAEIVAASRALTGTRIVLIVYGDDGSPFADEDCLLNVKVIRAVCAGASDQGAGSDKMQRQRRSLLCSAPRRVPL